MLEECPPLTFGEVEYMCMLLCACRDLPPETLSGGGIWNGARLSSHILTLRYSLSRALTKRTEVFTVGISDVL